MKLLVADVGGTNTRIALIRDRDQVAEMQRFENDGFSSFEAVLARYGEGRDLTGLTGCSIAIAGPVTAGFANLTNRGWRIEQGSVAAALALSPDCPLLLVNDLMALGFALPNLAPAQISSIRPVSRAAGLNRQALVVGVGTGFNVCVVNFDQHRPVVNAAELGHASLSANVSHVLRDSLGAEATQFATNEDLFSGAGLSRLFGVVSGGRQRRGPQILAGYHPERDDATSQTVNLFADALGVATREMVFQYLPYGGINFAGGVARGVLGSLARPVFLKALDAPGAFDQHIALVPVRMITDDAAALRGAAQFAQRKATSALRDTSGQSPPGPPVP